MYKWLLGVLVLGCMAGCKKEMSLENGTPFAPDTTGAYFPTMANSTWEYEIHQKTGLDSSLFEGLDLSQYGLSEEDIQDFFGSIAQTDTTYHFTLTSLGRDTIIEDESYAVMYNDLAESEGFMRSDSGDYFLRGDVFGLTGAGIDPGSSIEMLYLKDAPAGTSWQQQLSIDGQANDYTFTIKARDFEKTVKGVAYKNVIQVEMKNNSLSGGDMSGIPPQFAGLFDLQISESLYFAKGIGLIAVEMKPVMGNFVNISLIKADIKK